MGRWVTSKGRRIYIPDEGEDNPFAKKDDDISMRKSAGKTWVAHKSQQGKKRGVRDLDKPFDKEEDAIKFADTIEGKGQEDREPKRKRRTATEIEEENKRIQLHNEKQNALREIVHKGSTITKNKDVADEYKTDNRYSVIEQDGGYKIVKKDWENRVENKYKTNKDQINKDFDTKEKQIANNKKQADILNNKNAVESTTKLSDSNKKAAKQALDNFLWKSDVTGEEESVEISSNHFQHANLSNEKMIKVLNAYDTKHEYRLENTSEEKKVMGMKIKVNHQYIVREKRKKEN